MTLLYYTAAPFLDCALEIVNLLKRQFDVHLLIEIKSSSKSANILNLKELPKSDIADVSEVVDADSYKLLAPYLEGCASAKFFIHENRTSPFPMSKSIALWKYLRKLKADIIQIESINLRALPLIPFLFANRRILLTMHDTIPHTGENHWKIWLPRWLFFNLPISKRILFFSEFSKHQFVASYRNDRSKKFTLKMFPYSFFSQNNTKVKTKREHILFFGRISYYKGIDVLLKSIPIVLREYPNELFIIAGKSVNNYSPNYECIGEFQNNIKLLERYISNEELITLIQGAKFVVCPYLDASQSGVLMTSLALNTPVIATNVGAFPEYLEPGINGMLVPANNPEQLAEAMKRALKSELYKELENNISKMYVTNNWEMNSTTINNAYLSK